MLAGGACSGGARLLVGGGLAEGDDDIGERLGVAGRSSARPSLALAIHGEHISGSARGGEARPEAIEQPGTVGELRLQRRLVRGDGEVGIEQPRAAILVWHPRIHEVHTGSRRSARFLSGRAHRRSGVPGPLSGEQRELEARHPLPCDRRSPDRECRIHPVPEASTPEGDPVLGRSLDGAAQGRVALPRRRLGERGRVTAEQL